MRLFIKNIPFHFTGLLITVLLLFTTGYPLSAIEIDDSECCCSDNISIQYEYYKCGKTCCVIVEAGSQNFEGRLPNQNYKTNNFYNQVASCAALVTELTIQETNSENRSIIKPQKLFLLVSVFRI